MRKHYKKHVRVGSNHNTAKQPHKIIAKAIKDKFKYTAGPIIIAIGGPGGTGKTCFAKKLSAEIKNVPVLALDDYKTSRAERAQKNVFGPHPHANQMRLIASHLRFLKRGKSIEKPVYCRKKGDCAAKEKFSPSKFIIVEGEVATYKEFHKYIDFSVFIDSHWKTQLNTRIKRDIEERGYTPKKAIAAFLYSNLHEFSEYGAESKNWSDVHIHCDENYNMVLDAVCSKSAKFLIEDVSSALACTFFETSKQA